MIQLFLLTVSFVYGLITGLIYNFINRKALKEDRLYILFNTIFFVAITVLYVVIFFLLNNADIHLYMKLALIIGFALSFKVSNLSKSNIIYHSDKLFKKIK